MAIGLCGGFRVVLEDSGFAVREWPGERRLGRGVADAVLRGLAEAPQLLSQALRLRAPRQPWKRVEVTLVPGALTLGEALPVAEGCIRLSLGEAAPAEEAARIARHEALHLLLAASMRGGERWNDPELAFADWIVRGLESHGVEVPRFAAPLPGILEKVPASRGQVQAAVGAPSEEYFGPALCAALQGIEGDQGRLWLTEAALGLHYLEAAGRLEPSELRPLLLDDWLAEYEQYARAVANPPSGAGNLWRLSEAGWSRDPLQRLSAAAQALQCDDGCVFAAGRVVADPLVWKQRGKVRLPLVRTRPRLVQPPLHGFRAALRAIDAPRAAALLEQAAAGPAQQFEARALWPRILARLLAAGGPAPAPGPALPAVQLVESADAYESYDAAAGALKNLLGERAGWVPPVLPPRPAEIIAESRPQASLLLVYATPLTPEALFSSRRLAAELPVRGAVFRGLAGGDAYERIPDQEPPLDPRYREETWTPGPPPPASFDELIAQTDEATREGRLSTPLSQLLAMMAVGVEECIYAISGTDPTG